MNRPEQELQKTLAAYMRACFGPPPLGPWWTAVNPSPGKTKAAAGLSKAMGMRAGVPDFLLYWDGRLIGIELKADKGRATAAQDIMAEEFTAAGGRYHVCRSLNEFRAILEGYGIPSRETRGRAA